MKTNQGFIALLSSIILSAIILLVLTTLSFGQFYTRYDILDSELKEQSKNTAEACVDETILKTTNNPQYTGNQNISIQGVNCFIDTINSSGKERTFKVRVVYKNHYTNIKIIFNSETNIIRSWEEIPIF